MHGYIGKNDITALALESFNTGRESFVLPNVKTKDIDELINCCMITLSNSKFNTNIFLIPKVFNYNKTKNIVFSFRKGTSINNLSDCEKEILHKWCKAIGIISISNFVRCINK